VLIQLQGRNTLLCEVKKKTWWDLKVACQTDRRIDHICPFIKKSEGPQTEMKPSLCIKMWFGIGSVSKEEVVLVWQPMTTGIDTKERL